MNKNQVIALVLIGGAFLILSVLLIGMFLGKGVLFLNIGAGIVLLYSIFWGGINASEASRQYSMQALTGILGTLLVLVSASFSH